MEGSLISQGVELMLFGMGTVIVFLTMLVFATGAMSSFVTRFLPEPEKPPAAPAAAAPAAGPAAADAQTLAVISAAIHQHRSRR